jgi:hypothetical protein
MTSDWCPTVIGTRRAVWQPSGMGIHEAVWIRNAAAPDGRGASLGLSSRDPVKSPASASSAKPTDTAERRNGLTPQSVSDA